MSRKFSVGAVFPTTEIGTDPAVIRAYAEAVESMGFHQIVAYDHVVGADVKNRPEWDISAHPYTYKSAFYEPIVLFSYLAAVTRKVTLLSGVVVLPQRQTVLFAKQAAIVDVLSSGRLLLGVGLGWCIPEYDAVGEGLKFSDRAPRMEDQIRILKRLWTEEVVTETSAPHKIVEVGINPLPVQRPIPILIGGGTEIARKRAARIGEGWFPFLDVAKGADQMAKFRAETIAAGRNPDTLQFQNNILLGSTMGPNAPLRTAEDGAKDAEIWKSIGATGVCFSTMDMGHKSLDGHLKTLRKIADLLKL